MNVEEKWPVLGRHERAAEWLGIWTNLGRAPRTIDAYARGLAEYLLVCERDGVDPLAANRSQVALFVRELATRPHRRGANVVALDSGVGLSNATLQQRLVPVRLFYDFLIEEGLRDSNPVGRGRYTAGRQFGGGSRPLVATGDERAAVDDGHTAVNALLARLTDVPTPAGPTPQQIGVPPTVTLLPIVQVTQRNIG